MLYMKTLINRRIYQNKQKRGDKSLIKIHINIYIIQNPCKDKKTGTRSFFFSKEQNLWGNP